MRALLLSFIFILHFPATGQKLSTAKPWTYWWWMGSAVTKDDISHQLRFFKENGLGGVHIIPIYGVKGYESAAIPFLTPKWLEVLQYTVSEGRRLGLGVDLTTGTGWPFGGPNVPAELAAKNMSIKNGEMAVKPTKQKVKRAAPGGEGFVLDPFHQTAMKKYLSRFDSAFQQIRVLPRSMYMDSYEAYGANWTDDFMAEFKKRRGYDFDSVKEHLTDSTRNLETDLIKMDYHSTLADLILERYARPWTKWSSEHGFLTRYQAHGSPGNLLDLYDAADIPETESFGTSRFDIPGLRIDPDYSIDQFGTPNPLAMKFASSAANLSGKKLVSSETGTWLANHFKVSLSQIKPQIDELFTAGINHIFYHGTNYSPVKESYPGWLFYASTDFGPQSHFAGEFSLLNRYVEKCQEILQGSIPDNDILLYFPIHDLWATRSKSAGGVHLLEVHHVDRWLLDLPFGKLAQYLWKNGFTFDYISDLQLEKIAVKSDGTLSSGVSTYKTIVIPETTYLPQATLSHLKRLADQGARIIFNNKMPDYATGYFNHSHAQQAFQKTLTDIRKTQSVNISDQLESDLKVAGVRQEVFSRLGLTFIRKKSPLSGTIYFVANLSNNFKEGWIEIDKAKNLIKDDPLTGKSILPKKAGQHGTAFLLTLLPGQSCFLIETQDTVVKPISKFQKREVPINSTWNLTFSEGRPHIPEPAKLDKLISWTTLPDSAVYFSGKAHYKTTFDLSPDILRGSTIVLDLGDVRESARVKLNGKYVGTAWSIPFHLPLNKADLKQQGNVLEVEVTNLSANYMRLRDQQSPDWKKFLDINIVDITYKKFDASKWQPMPSGLLGPVKLIIN